VQTPEHSAFFVAYHKKYNDYPRLGSVVGTARSSRSRPASSAPAARHREADQGLRGPDRGTPFGKIGYRAEDHQSTMGAFVGKTKTTRARA